MLPSLFRGRAARRAGRPHTCTFVEHLESRTLLAAGRGFTGYYFQGTDFTARKFIREDDQIAFNWTGGTPDASKIAPGSGFGARWSARVQPKFSELYRFYTRSTGGVRVWVNNNLIIDDFTVHPLKDNKGTINLKANVRYDIKIEYYDTSNTSILEMHWASARQPREAIPMGRLFASVVDTTPPAAPTGLRATYLTDTAFKVGWNAASMPEWDRIVYGVYLGKTKLGATTLSSYTRAGRNPDTNYSITAATYDFAGNAAFGPSLMVRTKSPYPDAGGIGLAGSYYGSDDLTDFLMTRTDPKVEFAWVSSPVGGSSDDPFSARWAGTLVPKYDELYTFYTFNDGGVRLWVGDQLLIDAWDAAPGGSPVERSEKIALAANQQYDIRVEYRHVGGDPVVMTSWSSLSQRKEVINSTQLFPAFVDTTPPTAPGSLHVINDTTDSITIGWSAATDDIGVVRYDVFRDGTFIGSTANTSYTDGGLIDDTQYTYTVFAIDGVPLNSAASNPLSARTDALPPRDAFSTIPAVDFNGQQGITSGGGVISDLNAGDWVRYRRLNFGGGAQSLRLRLGVPESYAGGEIEIRLDSPGGPLVGRHTIQPTGSYSTRLTQRVGINPVSGTRDLYFVFRGGSGGNSVASIESFEFSSRRLVRVMPLGDSITRSFEGRRSYRYYLYQQLIQAGHEVDFVGSQISNQWGSPSSFDFDQNHEGHAGIRADEVLANIVGWVQAADPEIVLIHLGTNDIWQGQSAPTTAGEIGQIIDAIRNVNPSIKIVLGQIIPLVGFETEVQDFNTHLAALAASKNVPLADHYAAVSTADQFDGVHPNDRGERDMADVWYDALAPLLA